MKINYKKVETIEEFIDAVRIRVNVFIKELGREPGWDPDKHDKSSEIYVAKIDEMIVSTVRVRKEKPRVFKIERMATRKKYRSRGIAQGLLGFVIENIKRSDTKRIWAQSNSKACKFYQKCGFTIISEPYDFYGTEHIDLELK